VHSTQATLKSSGVESKRSAFFQVEGNACLDFADLGLGFAVVDSMRVTLALRRAVVTTVRRDSPFLAEMRKSSNGYPVVSTQQLRNAVREALLDVRAVKPK
jgi:hypothetical protein